MVKFNNTTLRNAINEWTNPATKANALGTYGDINTWDVSEVTHMNRLFDEKETFNDDISNWDVSNVTTMAMMFHKARSFNQDLSRWDVLSVTNMNGMFANADSFNGDISGWDVSRVTDLRWMFVNAIRFNQDISSWDVSNAAALTNMFLNANDLSHENKCAIRGSFKSQNPNWPWASGWFCLSMNEKNKLNALDNKGKVKNYDFKSQIWPGGITREKRHAVLDHLFRKVKDHNGTPLDSELLIKGLDFNWLSKPEKPVRVFRPGFFADLSTFTGAFYSPLINIDDRLVMKSRSGWFFQVVLNKAATESAPAQYAVQRQRGAVPPLYRIGVATVSNQVWADGDSFNFDGEIIYLGGVGGEVPEIDDIKKEDKPNYHRGRIKNRTWQKSFFPPGRNVSVANQYHHHQMSKRAIAALGTANSTTGNTTVKKHRVGNSKPRTENGVSAAARQPRAFQQCSSLRSRSRPHHGRLISIGNGGILTPSARAVGSMDRLARLKAAAMGGTKK